MKLVETKEDMFVGPEPMNVQALLKLRRDVRVYTYKVPHIAKFSPEAMNQLLRDLPPEALPARVDVQKVFGMTIEVDRNLREGEWMIGFRTSYRREVGNG